MLGTHTKEQDLRLIYVGRKFRYNSKYGGVVENITCKNVTVVERIEVFEGRVFVDDFELKIISDKNNVYDFNEVEFYENNIFTYPEKVPVEIMNPIMEDVARQVKNWENAKK